MYADFIWVAADQIFNQIGKARHMFGGQHDMALVMRVKIGTRTGYGSQHSMDPAGVMNTSPGWRIAAPATPLDYIGMMNSALRCKDPVVVLEHDADLYKTSGETPESDLDFHILLVEPQFVDRQRCDGSDLLSMVQQSLDAAESSGVDAEVIDLRWLDAASVDWDTIGESIRKTNNVMIVEQGSRGTSYGGWLTDEIQRRYFDWLDSPIQRISGAESRPPQCRVGETLPNENTVAQALVDHFATPGVDRCQRLLHARHLRRCRRSRVPRMVFDGGQHRRCERGHRGGNRGECRHRSRRRGCAVADLDRTR